LFICPIPSYVWAFNNWLFSRILIMNKTVKHFLWCPDKSKVTPSVYYKNTEEAATEASRRNKEIGIENYFYVVTSIY